MLGQNGVESLRQRCVTVVLLAIDAKFVILSEHLLLHQAVDQVENRGPRARSWKLTVLDKQTNFKATLRGLCVFVREAVLGITTWKRL